MAKLELFINKKRKQVVETACEEETGCTIMEWSEMLDSRNDYIMVNGVKI